MTTSTPSICRCGAVLSAVTLTCVRGPYCPYSSTTPHIYGAYPSRKAERQADRDEARARNNSKR